MSDERAPVQFLAVNELQAGQRIDNFLLTRLKGLPKNHLYRILRKGEVRVNKKRVKADYRLQAEDIVRIPPLRLSPVVKTAPPRGAQQLLANRILYEDKNLLIINKPAGMAVHGGSGVSFGVIEALREARPQEKFLELAHRLDRDTSGCLLLAKKPSILKELHALLRDKKVEKVYIALVCGHWPKQLRCVEAPLKKFELRSGERMVNVQAEGKPAITEFKIIQRFADATLIEARPLTGRTHQIRVHALHAGHPIVGDDKYGDKEINKKLRAAGCKRLFLHAVRLSFVLPSTGQKIAVEAQLDVELQDCIEYLL